MWMIFGGEGLVSLMVVCDRGVELGFEVSLLLMLM